MLEHRDQQLIVQLVEQKLSVLLYLEQYVLKRIEYQVQKKIVVVAVAEHSESMQSMLIVDDDADDDDDMTSMTKKTMNTMMMRMKRKMTNLIDANYVSNLNQKRLMIDILIVPNKFYLSIDQRHVYDAPITAKNQSVLDRFYRKIQRLLYSFDNLTFVLDLVLV